MRLRLIIFFLLVPFIIYASEVKKVVIDLRTGDLKTFEDLINGIANNIQYYQNKLEDLKVVIVAHGNSYKFFLKDLTNTMYKNDKEVIEKQKILYQRLKNLVEFYGVKIQICEAGMKSRKLKKENLYKFVKPVYTALTGVVEWQNKGYAYMIIP